MDKVSNNVIPYNVLQTIIGQVDSGYISPIEGYVVPNSFDSKSKYIPVYEFLNGKTSYNDYKEIKNCGTYFLDYLLELDYGRTFVFRYSYEAKEFICSKYLSDCFKKDIKLIAEEEADEVALNILNSDKAINDMSEEEIGAINKVINNYYKRVRALSDNFKNGVRILLDSKYYNHILDILFQKKLINNFSNKDFEIIKDEILKYYNNYVYLSDLRRNELNRILPLEEMIDKVNLAINIEEDDDYRLYAIKEEMRKYYDAKFSLISFSKDDIRRLLSTELIKGTARELLDNDKPLDNMSKRELEIINDEVFDLYQKILLGSYNYKETLKELFQDEKVSEVALNALNGNKIFNEMSEEERNAINLELDNLYTKLRINISGLADIFYTYLLKLNGAGVVSYIKHNESNTELACEIIYSTGLDTRSEYYSERGVNYEFRLEHIKEIFSKLYKYDLEYAIEYVKMINKMPILSVKRFIDTFFKFAKEGFKADFLNDYYNSIDDKDYDDIIKSNNMKKYFREYLESTFGEVDFNKYFAGIVDEEELYLRRLRQNK